MTRTAWRTFVPLHTIPASAECSSPTRAMAYGRVVGEPGPTGASLERPTRHALLRWLTPAGLVLLVSWVALQTALAWRYFPSFLGDQGWYLQVAARMARGEILYRDIAWVYGPLPADALAGLFRLAGSDASMATLLNGTLSAALVLASYAVARALHSPTKALLVTAFATVIGAYTGGDLARLGLYTYTQAMAWGALASLIAIATGARWVETSRAG